ncbi:3-deoxy-D-manno-octulosonic acid transferase [Algibacter pectinivorans]|uniref:3-deoxy-D-manno-octulosonic acid transferase n=1 Tax=Algibacter pectinivorans TaxID=870482 RepID=UPI000B8986FB|nr:glycosyltransferase N-terminal domain-containing protein [Algibacter pectinivorans]
MNLIYNIGIHLTGVVLKLGAQFNAKLKKGAIGRENTFKILKNSIQKGDKTLWFHCASLGEYEQGLPVFLELRKHYKNHKIILSFFSPSGYEIRKNSPIANVVIYLPLDTKTNAKRFLDLIDPELTIFVKYDIWPNFLNELKSRHLRAILISAAFRKEQSYFKFYGKQLKQALFAFEHIFTQNEASKVLLESINYTSVTVSGDTRYDRVYSQLSLDNSLNFIDTFKNNKLCIVAGSTWPEGEALFTEFINTQVSKDIKFIIAPHDIKPDRIKKLQEKINAKTVLFSERDKHNLAEFEVFIIDTIGILSKIYSYADIAYVGGAVGTTGLHNTLEPAVFGTPILIGNNHAKFLEAQALIDNGGMFEIDSQLNFNKTLNKLITDRDFRLQAGSYNKAFIEKNKGAVIHILDYLRI